MNVLIIPDKFKGTLTAADAAQAVARGWRQVRPRDSLTILPMSDGGDGFGEVVGELLGAKIQNVKTIDAAHRPGTAHWWWQPKLKTAIVESASVIGLAKLPAGKFHPFELDTFGLGAVIRAAAAKGARRCFIGIGGSATNDGGFGLARALGWKFLDRDGAPIDRWTGLHQLARISPPKRTHSFRELIVAVDVQNPLLGHRGATRVYGPQKGLRTADFAHAEKCLAKLARISRGPAAAPGSGAAGGLGFGLRTFLGATMKPGFHLFAHLSHLDKHLRAADLVITGEGGIDESTFMGKGAGAIARRCRKLKIPCVALAGNISDRVKADGIFSEMRALTELTAIGKAKSNPARWLERLAVDTAKNFASHPLTG